MHEVQRRLSCKRCRWSKQSMSLQSGQAASMGWHSCLPYLLGNKLCAQETTCVPLQDNHVFTSGATGTNAAVIRGALRAEKPHLLTVVLPQSLSCQPSESQELLQEVQRQPCDHADPSSHATQTHLAA